MGYTTLHSTPACTVNLCTKHLQCNLTACRHHNTCGSRALDTCVKPTDMSTWYTLRPQHRSPQPRCPSEHEATTATTKKTSSISSSPQVNKRVREHLKK